MTSLIWVCALLVGGTMDQFGESDREPGGETRSAGEGRIATLVVATREVAGAGVLQLLNRIAVAVGEVGTDRGRSLAVRQIAQRLVQNHERGQRRLQRWLDIHLPAAQLLQDADGINAADRTEFRLPRRLRRVRPEHFDRSFLRAVIAMEAKSKRFVSAARRGIEDRELDGLLGDVALTLAREGTRARRLLAEDSRAVSPPPLQPRRAALPGS